MFKAHRFKRGTTKCLLYWQCEWAKRFLRTWWHIIYRPAYHNWKADLYIKRLATIDRREIDHGGFLEVIDEREH